MMFRYWLPYSTVVNVPSTFIVNSPSSSETISIYRFLYFGSWNTFFTAMTCPVHLMRDLYTFPKVPCPIKERYSISFSDRFFGVQSNVPSFLALSISLSRLLLSTNFLTLLLLFLLLLCSKSFFSYLMPLFEKSTIFF